MKIVRWYDSSYTCWEGEAETLSDAVKKAVAGGANLRGANLRGANLGGANLGGADLRGRKIKTLRVFAGLYRYQVWAGVWEDGSPFVRMGCQFRTVAEWDAMGGIRESRVNEFPNDGSSTSEQRARAFEFARIEALEMAKIS